jgi:hypothetical protein
MHVRNKTKGKRSTGGIRQGSRGERYERDGAASCRRSQRNSQQMNGARKSAVNGRVVMPVKRRNLTSKNTAPVLPLKRRPEQCQKIARRNPASAPTSSIVRR